MSYTALYRKFRPENFKDVKGQEHIVTTLKNQIAADRIGHAYLFCGTRGTGKTTIAKLFAKTVNCENPVDGNPCGECASCKAIAAAASMDVQEIDAASNNGVENIREIINDVSYSPTSGKYKVYIIDEVHMLSIGAFNALLKTLEEPPSYCIFILATTEVHKIPITILSRCQRYDFKRISVDTIVERLNELIEKEEMKVEEKALRYIAKMADGAMRDAISLLDQCIAFHIGETLSYDMVLDVLGAVDTEVFSRLLRGILKGNVISCIDLLEEIIIQGRDLTQFVTDFIWYLRNLLVVKTSEDAGDVLDVSTETKHRLIEEAELIEPETIIRYIRVFSELSGSIKYGTQKRILTEIALIKLCRPQMEFNKDSILDRIRILEDQMKRGIPVEQVSANSDFAGAKNGDLSINKKVELPKALPEDIKKVVLNWAAIVNGIESGLMKTALKKGNLSLGDGDKLLLVMEESVISGNYFKEEGAKEELEKYISNYMQKQIPLEIRWLQENQNFEDNYPNLKKLVGIDIEIVNDEEMDESDLF